MASRLVIASNRVPAPGGAPAAGGLASALLPVMQDEGGLWFGWSGAETSDAASTGPALRREGAVEFATLDLTPSEVAGYYGGFCNRVLWPLLHGLPERAHIEPGGYELWRSVNVRFARALFPLLEDGDLVWVHDYHLIPLGEALRTLGWRGRLGFFLHIPVPLRAAWERIPHAAALATALDAYDLVGLQAERDAERLGALAPALGGRVAAFPIGIDPAHWRRLAAANPDDPFDAPDAPREGRRVMLGVDRLDYTKGIPQRLRAFERLLDRDAAVAGDVTLVQWAAPSRSTIPEYVEEGAAVERAATRIRARDGGAARLRYERTIRSPEMVAAALRDADVCLVTSVADGMNLVAKEFVAVQRPERPGVLILSDGCGAAAKLTEALIVDAADLDSIAAAMARALEMPLEERQQRWQALSASVESNTVHDWRSRFVAGLASASA